MIGFVQNAAGMQVGFGNFGSQTLEWHVGHLRSGDATRHGSACKLWERTDWCIAFGCLFLSASAVLPTLAKCLGFALPLPRNCCILECADLGLPDCFGPWGKNFPGLRRISSDFVEGRASAVGCP